MITEGHGDYAVHVYSVPATTATATTTASPSSKTRGRNIAHRNGLRGAPILALRLPPLLIKLQHLRRMTGKARTLAALQCHLTAVLRAFETIDNGGQARTSLVEMRSVDPRDAAKANHLDPRSVPDDERINLRVTRGM